MTEMIPAYQPTREAHRRLRLALVSGRLDADAGLARLLPIVTGLDPRRFDPFLYGDVPAGGPVPAYARALARWCPVGGWDDARLAAELADDMIDVLIDLDGWLARNRPALAPRRVAPIQVVAGLAPLDAPGFDAMLVSPAQWTAADLAGLGRPYHLAPAPAAICWTGAGSDPPGARTAQGPVLEVALALPDTVPGLVGNLLRGLLDLGGGVRVALIGPALDWGKLADRGLADLRLSQRPTLAVARTDLLLVWPGAAPATVLTALGAGVPTLGLAAETPTARLGAALLAAAGLPELALRGPADWLVAVRNLLTHPDGLRGLRAIQAARATAAPLFNVDGMTQALGDLLLLLWQRYAQAAA